MADSDSEISNFEEGVNIASAQKLNIHPPGSLPSLVEQNYSLNEFEIALEFKLCELDKVKNPAEYFPMVASLLDMIQQTPERS